MSLFQISEDGQSWQCSRREDSKGSSDGGVAEAWEFRSALEAPIARLESLDELEGSQVGTRRFGLRTTILQRDLICPWYQSKNDPSVEKHRQKFCKHWKEHW